MSSPFGPFPPDRVVAGDCATLIPRLPESCLDVVVTSPPYWGQRTGPGLGGEADPRDYLAALTAVFSALLPKLKPDGILWINLGDAYDTPVNWRLEDRRFSTLGAAGEGLGPDNSAYTKPRGRRRACLDPAVPWLRYGNLLALPYRLVLALTDAGWLFRGEVVWSKRNPMPEGRARRPHQAHEGLYLLARGERHAFRTRPPVKSVWEIANERIPGEAHFSRFPTELPRRCIEALGRAGPGVMVLDPFAGSGSTGIAAKVLGCRFLGFEIDPGRAAVANGRLEA
jgi:DNA modification methylase